jgi:dTDP-4-amino-4,6-dideoxygalactose transaminase
MRKIRVGDFKLRAEEKQTVNEVLDSGRISEGPKVREFENLFKKYIGTKFCIATSSGTGALITGLTALKYHQDLKEKTKVVTTPLTYIATSSSISNAGFVPVYVDVDRETFVITPENIEAHLADIDDISEYSIILPVHLMGYPCKMDDINKIAKKYGCVTFEDAAQAHGTIYKGKKTGSWGLLASFSFYVAHNIQAGEMGSITTDNSEIARLCGKIKAQGRACDCPLCTRSEGKCPKIYVDEEDLDPRFTHEVVGYNFKPMEFQAALGIIQVKKADWIFKARQENVKYLNESLENFSDILQLPKFGKNISYLAYPIVINKAEKISRKKLRLELEEKYGIETRPLFGCIPTQQPAYQCLKSQYEGKLPNAEYIGLNGFYIGCHQYLTQEDLDYITKAFKEILSHL